MGFRHGDWILGRVGPGDLGITRPMIWKLELLHSYLTSLKGILAPRGLLHAHRFAATLFVSLVSALFFSLALHAVAFADIVLDGTITEPNWQLLGNSVGGPPPSFGDGNEINALYADINSTNFFIGVAGNVQDGNSILVFIDSMPGGYNNSNFGRAMAPPGIANFNPTSGTAYTQFDNGFTPNYVLSIRTISGQGNFVWDLFTLSGSVGVGGGPNLYLGDRNDVDLRANPTNGSQTNGFEARLTYSVSGVGVDIAINQPEIKMMAMYINNNGTLSNQFISHAGAGETANFGNGQISFNTASPNFVSYTQLLVVNEIDYIQPGPNDAEFIEIMNITNISLNLDSYHVNLATGAYSPPTIYRSDIDLPNYTLGPGAYFVICTNPGRVPRCNMTVPPPTDLLDNSLPSAVALMLNTLIVDVVSYGGTTGAPYSEGAGVDPADDPDQPLLGLSRVVNGLDTNQNSVDFGLRCITPGQANSYQTGGCGPVTPVPTWPPPGPPTSTPTTSPGTPSTRTCASRTKSTCRSTRRRRPGDGAAGERAGDGRRSAGGGRAAAALVPGRRRRAGPTARADRHIWPGVVKPARELGTDSGRSTLYLTSAGGFDRLGAIDTRRTIMNADVGDKIVVKGHHVGEPDRDAVVLEVVARRRASVPGAVGGRRARGPLLPRQRRRGRPLRALRAAVGAPEAARQGREEGLTVG